jgi:hypothetical protein
MCDFAANFSAGGGLGFPFGVEVTQMRMIDTARSAAAADIGEGE